MPSPGDQWQGHSGVLTARWSNDFSSCCIRPPHAEDRRRPAGHCGASIVLYRTSDNPAHRPVSVWPRSGTYERITGKAGDNAIAEQQPVQAASAAKRKEDVNAQDTCNGRYHRCAFGHHGAGFGAGRAAEARAPVTPYGPLQPPRTALRRRDRFRPELRQPGSAARPHDRGDPRRRRHPRRGPGRPPAGGERWRGHPLQRRARLRVVSRLDHRLYRPERPSDAALGSRRLATPGVWGHPRGADVPRLAHGHRAGDCRGHPRQGAGRQQRRRHRL